LAVSTDNPDATSPSAPKVDDISGALDDRLRPTALEIASGGMYGDYDASATLDHRDRGGLAPLAALEEAVVPALRRPPCLVSFSGGRDSSCVLAVAVGAARREGLPPPVPITVRVPNALLAEESAWQKDVIQHLGLRDWEVVETSDEMDCLGPFSTRVLRRHGVLYPSNTFLHLPLLDAARGGALLTGFGGDEIFGLWRWSYHADLLARRRRPTLRDPIRFAHAVLPAALRRRRERRRWRWGADLPWLRPDAARMVTELAFAARADQPRSWPRWLDWLRHRRTLCAARWSPSLLAADADALLLEPLLDAQFLAAVASVGGRLSLGNRTTALRAIFGKLLPEHVLSRSTKSHYHEAFWGWRSREFAASWDGTGVDGELVEPAVLKREWLKSNPHRASAMLLQAAWLSQQAPGDPAVIA
jgi:asparagine synthetase B (glutamine-hydrolysing)